MNLPVSDARTCPSIPASAAAVNGRRPVGDPGDPLVQSDRNRSHPRPHRHGRSGPYGYPCRRRRPAVDQEPNTRHPDGEHLARHGRSTPLPIEPKTTNLPGRLLTTRNSNVRSGTPGWCCLSHEKPWKWGSPGPRQVNTRNGSRLVKDQHPNGCGVEQKDGLILDHSLRHEWQSGLIFRFKQKLAGQKAAVKDRSPAEHLSLTARPTNKQEAASGVP